MKKISIIIRSLNRIEYTIRTIVSIDELSGLSKDDYEIIIVDQNSSDGTKNWLISNVSNKYYPIKAVFLDSNIGDGRGMQTGIEISEGEFIAQHDNDIEIVSPDFYSSLISAYESLEKKYKICSLGGSHIQGLNKDSSPFRFASKRGDPETVRLENSLDPYNLSSLWFNFLPVSWNTGVFIFREKFKEIEFTKGMCNSWGGEWFDRGFMHFVCENINFWHIDSGDSGEMVQKQYDKFPFYSYIFNHYSNFIKKK